MRATTFTMLAALAAFALTLALGGCGDGDQAEQPADSTQVETDTAAGQERDAQIGSAAGVEPGAEAGETESAAEVGSYMDRAKAEAAAAAAKLQEAGEQAGAAAADAADSAMEAVKAKASEAAESLKQAGEQAGAAASAAASAAAEAAREKTAELTQSAGARAEAMMTQVQEYLRKNDLDSAQGIMDRLSGLRDEVSEQTRTDIDELQEQVADESQQ